MAKVKRASNKTRRSPLVDRRDSAGRPVGVGGAARQRNIDSAVDAAMGRMRNAQSTDSNN